MKTYAQFYHNSTGYVAGSIPPVFRPDAVRPIPACGSDSIYPLDSRLALRNAQAVAREVCTKRGFVGYHIERGSCLRDARQITAFVPLK